MQTKAVVIVPVADLFSEPTRSVDLVTQAIIGTEVAIWETRETWYYVCLPDQYRGWIEAANVRVYAPGEPPYASAGQLAQVDNLFAFLYREPGVSKHPPAMEITLGARLEVAEDRGDWLVVTLPDRAQRWIQRGDVRLIAAGDPVPRGDANALFATAKRFLGLPYLWGGSTPFGIDCSGFVQLVYQLNGVSLLRDADIQHDQPGLRAVERAALQPGDLLFFGENSVTHVGMYIGDGEFIHSTTNGRPVVQISRLDDPPWTVLYRDARRP